MPATASTPSTWTLRCKNHMHTTLLHVEPLQSFTSIIEELLHALHTTHPNGLLPTGNAIPDSPDSVALAKLTDANDPSGGWTRLNILPSDLPAPGEDSDKEEADQTENPNRQRKPTRGRSTKAATLDTLLDSSPKMAGLRDGAVVAYKFRTSSAADDDHWDVVMPTFDDAVSLLADGDIGSPSSEDARDPEDPVPFR